MAKSSGLGMVMFLGGYDLSGDVGAIDNIQSTRNPLDVTGINKSSMERVYGQVDAQIGFTTWFNDAAGQEHAALKTLPTTDLLALVGMQGTAGSPSAMLTAKQANYDFSRGSDGSLSATVNLLGNGKAIEWGTILLAKATICATGNSASQDNAAATCNGLAAQIHVTAFTGTNYTATIQESSDDGCTDCFATLVAFAAKCGANQSERISTSGAVERYLRINHAGTFCSVDVVIATRRGLATDIEGY